MSHYYKVRCKVEPRCYMMEVIDDESTTFLTSDLTAFLSDHLDRDYMIQERRDGSVFLMGSREHPLIWGDGTFSNISVSNDIHRDFMNYLKKETEMDLSLL